MSHPVDFNNKHFRKQAYNKAAHDFEHNKPFTDRGFCKWFTNIYQADAYLNADEKFPELSSLRTTDSKKTSFWFSSKEDRINGLKQAANSIH